MWRAPSPTLHMPLVNGSDEMLLPPREPLRTSCWERRGSKQEKERTSKKSSNTTGTISLPSLAHTRLCHRRCPQSVPQCPAAAAHLLGFLQQGLTGRNLTVMQRLNATALPIPAGLLTAVPCCAFLGLPCCWKRQLSVQPQLSKIAIMVIIMPQSKQR